jgi:hypothetical protein
LNDYDAFLELELLAMSAEVHEAAAVVLASSPAD